MANNPPWADKLLNENWDAIQASMQDRGLPLEWLPTHSHGRTKVHPSKELGCGSYGCVYATDAPDVVCKVTTDVSEAAFIGIVKNFEKAGEVLPPGLVRYFEILALKGKRGKRDAFILWREEAFGFFGGTGGIPKDFLPNDSDESYRKQLWHRFERYLIRFLQGSTFVREIIQRYKKRTQAEKYWDYAEEGQFPFRTAYWDWVEGQFRAMDEHWAEFNEVLHGDPGRFDFAHASAFHMMPKSLTEESDAVYRYLQPKHPLYLAFKLYMLFDTAVNMTNENGSHYIGEAFQFFFDKRIILADVHMANVAFVCRYEDDYSSDVPIIVDPGHAVFLSSEYSDVSVKGVGE